MPLTPKDWRNAPDTSTPISAEALEDMEARLGAYADGQVNSRQATSQKGLANGYPGLGANGYVPTAQQGSGTADNTKALRGDQSWAVLTAGEPELAPPPDTPTYRIPMRNAAGQIVCYAAGYTGVAPAPSPSQPTPGAAPVIETANRANEGPPISGWGNDPGGWGAAGHQIDTNQIRAGSGWSESYYLQRLTPNPEVRVTLAVAPPASRQFYLHARTALGPVFGGYFCGFFRDASNSWIILTKSNPNGVEQELAADILLTPANGDSLALVITPTHVEVWHRVAATGAWTRHFNVADTTYLRDTGGYLVIAGDNTETRIDDVAATVDPGAPAPIPTATQGKFHRVAIGTNQTGLATSAARDEIIILQAHWRAQDLLDTIKDANPNCKVLCYFNTPRSYPTVNGVYASAISTEEAAANSWTSGIVDAWGSTVLKIDIAACRTRITQAIANRLNATRSPKGRGFDGAMHDRIDASGDGYGTDAQYRGWIELLNAELGPALQAQGFLTVPNLTGAIGSWDFNTSGWVEAQFKYYSGALDEFFATWNDGSDQAQDYVDRAFDIMGRQAGKLYLADVLGSETRAIFGLACVMLQTGGAGHLAWPTNNNYESENWATAFDTAKSLGQAKAAKFSIGTKHWQRDFQFGYVTANLVARTGTIVRT